HRWPIKAGELAFELDAIHCACHWAALLPLELDCCAPSRLSSLAYSILHTRSHHISARRGAKCALDLAECTVGPIATRSIMRTSAYGNVAHPALCLALAQCTYLATPTSHCARSAHSW